MDSKKIKDHKQTLVNVKQAINELQHHQRLRKRYGAKGIFDVSQHLDSFGAPPPASDDEGSSSDDDNASPSNGHATYKDQSMPTDVQGVIKQAILSESEHTKPMHKRVTRIDGKCITVKDFAMRWLNLSESTMDSTHEIAFSSTDRRFVWVTGMMDNQLARVSVANPRHAQFLQFPAGSQPHTVRFDAGGAPWVGLEVAGIIVKLVNIPDWDGSAHPPSINLDPATHYQTRLDVRLQASPPTIPCPINTHPHGFCFDKAQRYIYFTGKLTNTVGRVNVSTGAVQHFALPTLGAVPIYVSLGPDGNVWGTCLANNNIFRITTTEDPIVTEIPITATSENSRPIAIVPAPNDMQYMWFSNEATHTVARVDCAKVEAYVKVKLAQKKEKASGEKTACTCSKFFYAASHVQKAVTEFAIPRPQSNMLMAGIAFDDDGYLWTQSYVDSGNPDPKGPDYIVRVDKCIHNAKVNAHGSGRITGIPFQYFEAPTRDSIMHRIIKGPDGNVWFTELGADRIGTVSITKQK